MLFLSLDLQNDFVQEVLFLPIRGKPFDKKAPDDLNSHQGEMYPGQCVGKFWKRAWPHTKYQSGNNFCKADVSLCNSMMQKVQGLSDQ